MPPFLATLAGKVVGLAVVLALAFSTGLYEGCAIKQQAWDAAIAMQAMASAAVVVKGAENTGRVIIKYDRKVLEAKVQAEARAEALQKELEEYVATHPACPVPDAIVRVFDATDGLPAAASPAGGTAAPGESVTLVGVLQALKDYRDEYGALADRNAALIEWVRSSYDVQRGN